MIFGDKEWMDNVNKSYEFPLVLSMHLVNADKPFIASSRVDTTAENVGNIRYSQVALGFSPKYQEKMALISVRRIKNAEEYLAWATQLRKAWKIED